MSIRDTDSWKSRLREERVRRNWRQTDLAERLGTSVVTVQRWEKGSQQPSAYFRIKLEALFGKKEEELVVELPEPLPAITQTDVVNTLPISLPDAAGLTLWNVPHPRNPHFTGREDLLEYLHNHLAPTEKLTTPRHAALTQTQAIKGLGGIGKTQIAVEYAYQAAEQGHYTYILWLNAANEEALLTSFAALAELLPDFEAKGETDQHKLVAAIKDWLEQCEQPWLLIFDNADDLSLIQSSLPQRGKGSILLTTRAHAVGFLASSLEVETMGLVEGVQFLLHRAQRLSPSEVESNEAMNIVIALDGFPLALDQAGAYIEETGCSFVDYLKLYHDHCQELLTRRGKQATHYPDSVATTWSLSFQKVERSNPAAAELLRLCAFLAPDRIPDELLIEGRAHWPASLQQGMSNRLTFNHMMEALLAFSLVKRLVKDQLLSVHRLVQVVQREQMEPEEQRRWAECVVRGVHAVFPSDPRYDVASWPTCLRYLEQAQACDGLIQEHQLLLPEAAEVLSRAGLYLYIHASHSLAESLYQRALWIKEQCLGSEHIEVAATLHALAMILRDRGKYEEAEALHQRVLRIREQHLGSEHPEVADTLHGLATILRVRGRYEEAEAFYQRVLRIRERHLGLEHPDLVDTLNNLALIAKERGRYEEAEAFYLRALHIGEQQLGPDHPEIAPSLCNLAIFYRMQGKYMQAETLYLRALRLWERLFGPDHPGVCYSLNGLANLHVDWGKYEEAEPLYQRALRVWERQFGPDHPGVCYPLNSLATLYTKMEKYAEAEPLYERALSNREQHLGPDHPDVSNSLNGLANLHMLQGDYPIAESLYERALHIRESALGPLHLNTAETLHDFARLKEAQGNFLEAASLYRRSLAIREQVLGPVHERTRETSAYLEVVLAALDQMKGVCGCEAGL